MCELFGFTAKTKTDISPALRVFFSHGDRNPSGWGLALDVESKTHITLAAENASQSTSLKELLSVSISQRLALAHLRKATVGAMNEVNCHPFCRVDFSGRKWLLIHNGTIFSGFSVDSYAGRIAGSTDSECILAELVDRINEKLKRGANLNPLERFLAVEDLITELSPRNKLNLLLSDGELLYVHMNMRNTLYSLSVGDGRFFATIPLDDAEWEPVELTTVLAYRSGQLLYRGENHGYEYINTITSAPGPLNYAI